MSKNFPNKVKPKQIIFLISKHIRQTSQPFCWILKEILNEQRSLGFEQR